MTERFRLQRQVLINHVWEQLRGEPILNDEERDYLEAYLALLPTGDEHDQVSAILTTLAPPPRPGGQAAVSDTSKWLAPVPLALNGDVVMGQAPVEDVSATLAEEWGQLIEDPVTQYELAAALIQKHCWAFPGSRGEAGVSLYEEFKLLSALVHASGGDLPAAEFSLIAGDFPGVQKFIYSVNSQGAARGLRGRSFFLQLLGDSVLRNLLLRLELPWTNVIFTAGGNFVLLTPADGAESVAPIKESINDQLLHFYAGDIMLSLASVPLAVEHLQGEGLISAYRDLKTGLAEQKLRPFQKQAVADYQAVFKPAHMVGLWELSTGDPEEMAGVDRSVPGMFRTLANTLARHHSYLSVSLYEPPEHSRWQRVLHDITGLWYGLHSRLPQAVDDQTVYVLNQTDLTAAGLSGFRFIATLTPRITEADVQDILENDLLDEDENGEAREPEPGDVRYFKLLARDSVGIRRLGVLRMDVDSLGAIFGSYIRDYSLSRVSAASMAMTLFFNGWLPEVCRQVEQAFDRANTLYVIYAGGDDLFIVGPWDILPHLAEHIREAFREYVNYNPHITISAGIAVADEKYPLYRAADLALRALDDQAKGHIHVRADGTRKAKDAICFLGEVAEWDEEWPNVNQQRDIIGSLVDDLQSNAPMRVVARTYQQYRIDREAALQRGEVDDERRIVWGRWMWMQAYHLTRLVDRYSTNQLDIAEQVETIKQELLNGERIHLAGLAARWVDMLRREREE